MPRTAWPDRLGRWLPPDVQHQWYRPALADARYLREQRRITHQSPLAAAWRELAFAATALGLVVECVRLTWWARLRGGISIQTLNDLRSGLKETPNMFTQDLRRALRIFRLQPGFAFVIVLTLAIGIGATTALFAVIDAALLRPLPYPDADRLVMLMHRDQSTGATKEFIAIGTTWISARASMSWSRSPGTAAFKPRCWGTVTPHA